MPADPNTLEDFRQALGAAMRALGRHPEYELAYTADKPACHGDQARVPQPARNLSAEQAAEARGWANSFALRGRLHDSKSHARVDVGAGLPREMLNAAEQARIEAIGGRDMAGVALNLRRMLDTRMKPDPIARARTPDEVPLATAVGLIVRERLTGQPVPDSAAIGVDMVRARLEEDAGAHLDKLAASIDDQSAFADAFRRVLADLGLAESGLSRVIRASYELLGYMSFFTVGEDEVRAWTTRRGATAQESAGEIHTDLQRGFVRAEVVAYEDLVGLGSMTEAKAKGKFRLEGKEYLVKDGDIMHVRSSI
jgi:cobalamin biosynthesis protein CobT